eukprot:XP_003724827.1 PREDICTED: leucine-rich repeat-containing protein 42 [Strongylocentrotus purpuratus]
MAYEAFPSDAVEAFNDPGIYYVHENGKLRSPPGLGHSSHTTAFSESGLPKLSPFDIGESTSDRGTCFVPRSLFQQTINFVARNLWRVESLVGFPDIVGKQLFDAAQSQGIFTNKQLRLTSLRLFVEAYDIEILSSLNLKRKHVTLKDYAGEIMLFSGLQELELGGCSLGEEHEMWSHIGSMPCLQKLGLGRTGLSDGVMQKLTTPLRLMGRGPKGLKVLDMSGNAEITERSIRFLKAFHYLEALDITSCCFSTHGLKQLHNEMCLRQLEDDEIDEGLDVFCKSAENIGWASILVEDWMSENRVATKQILPQGCPKARKFYSSSSNQLGFMDISVKTTIPVSTSSQTYIRLVRDTTNRDGVSTSEVKNSFQTGEKEQRTGMKDNGHTHTKALASKRFAQALQSTQEAETTVDKSEMSGHCVLHNSNQGPQNFSSLKEVENLCPGRSKLGLKVKLRRKRKRCPSDDEARRGNVQHALEDDDRDLMNSYLNIRTDGDMDLDKTGDRSKLMKAMDSLHW